MNCACCCGAAILAAVSFLARARERGREEDETAAACLVFGRASCRRRLFFRFKEGGLAAALVVGSHKQAGAPIKRTQARLSPHAPGRRGRVLC